MALTSGGGLMSPRSPAEPRAARPIATLSCPCRKPHRSWRSLSRTAAPLSRAVISSWLHVRGSARRRHERRRATRTFEQNTSGASRSLSVSLLVSPVDTTGSSSSVTKETRWKRQRDNNACRHLFTILVLAKPTKHLSKKLICWATDRCASTSRWTASCFSLARSPHQPHCGHFQYGRANTKAESATWIRNLAPHHWSTC